MVTHLANHALNLISLETAEAGRLVFLAVWRNPSAPSCSTVRCSSISRWRCYALYRRRTLVMPAREAAQVVLGLLIPLLVAEHVVGTRILHELYDADDTYEYVVRSLWIAAPAVGVTAGGRAGGDLGARLPRPLFLAALPQLVPAARRPGC